MRKPGKPIIVDVEASGFGGSSYPITKDQAKPHLAILLAGIVSAFLLACPGTALAEGCKRIPVGEWPVRLEGGRPIVDGAINGMKAKVLIHTTAPSLISPSAAERLKLKIDYRTTKGVPRGSPPQDVAKLDEFRIGSLVSKGLSVRVVAHIPGVDFVAGVGFLPNYDLEFDLPGGFVRAFDPGQCPGQSPAYWDPKAHELVADKSRADLLPVSINGARGFAKLDSGIGTSLVSPAFAEKAGIKPGGAGVLPAGCSARSEPIWMASFTALAVGGEVTPDARLHIGPHEDGVDMRLASDFLRTHRVLISPTRGSMYFSHIAGQSFTAVRTLPCDPSLEGKSRKERLAHLDAALTRNPRDASALLWRAWHLYRERPSQAIVDADAAIAVEPSNSLAYMIRAEARDQQKDHRGAIGDYDSAISLGQVDAAMYFERARIRRKVADYAGAIEDYDRALRIDPRDAAALRARGRHLYHAGRYDEAERDFTTLLGMSPRAEYSVWLSLARARRGMDARAALEAGRALLQDDEWPAPILDYLLGRIDREGLMAKSTADPKVRRERQCEARYYVAARLLVDGKVAEARPLLFMASLECPGHYVELESAIIDLKGI